MENKIEPDKQFERITSALSLIVVGFVLLLNTSGVLPWTVWIELLKFWPVFIISAGLSLILSFNNTSKIIAHILTFLIFIFILFYAAVNTGVSSLSGFNTILPKLGWIGFTEDSNNVYLNQEYKSIPISVNENLKGANMEVVLGAGKFELNSIKTDNIIASVNAINNNQEFSLESTNRGEVTDIKFENKPVNNFMDFDNKQEYYLDLNSGIYFDNFDMKVGASDATLNFENNISVNKINLESGASSVTMNFNEGSLPSVLNVKVGAGKTLIVLPENAGINVEYSVGVGSLKIEGERDINGLGAKGKFISKTVNPNGNTNITLDIGVGECEVLFK